jgi:secondary thiamine-phosphate synthase enzyme
MVATSEIRIGTRGDGDTRDLTEALSRAVSGSGVRSGVCHAFVLGSTAALTTIEFEPGLARDLPAAMERLAPADAPYYHEARWGDDNGHSHVRASTIGPSLTMPVREGRLCLGTWQQAVLIDFDTKGRDRTVVVTVIGE